MGSVPADNHIHEDIYEPLSPSLTRTATKSVPAPEQHAEQIRVAVIGGGIGGLCAALGLMKYPHLNVQIYEAAHKFSEIGAGIGVGPNAEHALELLGPNVYAAYAKEATRCPFKLCNGQAEGKDAGKELLPENSKASQSSVHRAHFLDSLVALIPPEQAHFGKRLVYIEDKTSEGGSYTLHFKDETTVEADAVVGADGVHSHTRDYVLGDADKDKYEPTYSGATCYRNLIPMERAVECLGAEISSNSYIFILDGSMIMSYPVDHSQRLNVVAYTWQFKEWTNKQWVIPVDPKEVLESFHGQQEQLTEMLKLFDKPSAWALWDLPSLPRYNRNRVCITGDAAHATTPFQGQGAGQAIEDALTISKLMAEVKTLDDIPYAFAAYDTVRRPRGNKNVVTSRKSGQISSLLDPEHKDLGEIGMGFASRMLWLWTKDMGEQCQEALDLFKEYKNKG